MCCFAQLSLTLSHDYELRSECGSGGADGLFFDDFDEAEMRSVAAWELETSMACYVLPYFPHLVSEEGSSTKLEAFPSHHICSQA